MKLGQNTAVSETSGGFFLNRIKMELVSKWFLTEDLIYAHGNNDMRVQQTDVKNCLL